MASLTSSSSSSAPARASFDLASVSSANLQASSLFPTTS